MWEEKGRGGNKKVEQKGISVYGEVARAEATLRRGDLMRQARPSAGVA